MREYHRMSRSRSGRREQEVDEDEDEEDGFDVPTKKGALRTGWNLTRVGEVAVGSFTVIHVPGGLRRARRWASRPIPRLARPSLTRHLTVSDACWAAITLAVFPLPPPPPFPCVSTGLWLTLQQYAELKAVLPQVDALVADALRTTRAEPPPPANDDGGAGGGYASPPGRGGAPAGQPDPMTAGGSIAGATHGDGDGPATHDGGGDWAPARRGGADVPPF